MSAKYAIHGLHRAIRSPPEIRALQEPTGGTYIIGRPIAETWHRVNLMMQPNDPQQIDVIVKYHYNK